MKKSKLKLRKMDLFYTPDSMDEVYAHIDRMPESARGEAVMAVAFTWNFMCELIESHNRFAESNLVEESKNVH